MYKVGLQRQRKQGRPFGLNGCGKIVKAWMENDSKAMEASANLLGSER